VCCSAALDVPVPQEALVDEAPRRANYHANRAAAYLERHKQLQVSAAACSGSSSSGGGGQEGSSTWCEAGGVLDGLLLDGSSPETHAQLLRAAVLDCKAALDLAPTHAKAHFRCVSCVILSGTS
jgi:hypothetical protein